MTEWVQAVLAQKPVADAVGAGRHAFALSAHVIGDDVLEVPVRVPINSIIAVRKLVEQVRPPRPAPGPPAGPGLTFGPLHKAAMDGNVARVERMLNGGMDVNAEDGERRTPLHVAAEWGRLEIVRLLLDRGAEPNATDLTGVTPTGLAVQGGHTEVADLLRDHGGVE